MEKRIAQVGIIVEDENSAEQVNGVLHEFKDIVVGRMGIPYRQKNVNIISVVLDGEMNAINTMVGKLGQIKNVSAKALFKKDV